MTRKEVEQFAKLATLAKFEAMPVDLLDALHDRGWDDIEIVGMDAETMFSEFCLWNGLVGWSATLLRMAKFVLESDDNAKEDGE